MKRAKSSLCVRPMRLAGVAHPAVELGADAVEVLGLRALLALADLVGVLAAQPRLDAVGVLVLADLVQLADALAPARAGGGPLAVVVDVGEQVALEHVRRAEREPAVVHGLEDRVGVVVGVGGDLDEVHVLDQPVDEVRQRVAAQLLGEACPRCRGSVRRCLHRLGAVRRRRTAGLRRAPPCRGCARRRRG